MRKGPGWKSDIARCLIPLIEGGYANLHVIATACDTLAACARFDIWVQEVKQDRRGSVEGFLQLLEHYEAAIKECQTAVQRFCDDGEWRSLNEALQRVTARLNERPESMGPPSQATTAARPPRSAK